MCCQTLYANLCILFLKMQNLSYVFQIHNKFISLHIVSSSFERCLCVPLPHLQVDATLGKFLDRLILEIRSESRRAVVNNARSSIF